MNKTVTYVLTAGLLAAGLKLTLVQAQGEPAAGAAPAPQPVSREIIEVKSGSAGGVVSLGGTVMPEKIVTLSAQMPGDVKFVAGAEGDAFKKGDRLVELDTTALRAKRLQAEAQLASADAGFRNAIVQYNRELLNPNAQAQSYLGGMPALTACSPTRCAR